MSTSGPQRWTYTMSPRALRNLRELPPDIATACADYIEYRLVTSPLRMSSPLGRPPLLGSRSARPVTGYRVVFRVDEEARHLEIERIGPRGNVYRR